MDSIVIERRRSRQPPEREWKRIITLQQAEMLTCLEQLGWSIRFVRVPAAGAPVAVVYDPDHKSLAIIEADGTLVENPKVKFRD